jgi:hypothetical protein
VVWVPGTLAGSNQAAGNDLIREVRLLSPTPECGASLRDARIRQWRADGKQTKYAGSCQSSRLTLT